MVDSRGALAQDGRRAERLELRVPTTATQLPAVRAMAGDLAMRMDYDLDAVEDLRLAVDEACATLSLVATGDAPLTVVFETTRAGLHIDAWVPTADGTEVPTDGFGWAVLAGLVDAVLRRAESDAGVAAAVRDALGPHGRLRLDANAAWDVEQAVAVLRRLARYDLEYVEQPCATVDELVALREAGFPAPVAADESVRKSDDPLRVARLGAADVVVLKVAPMGVVERALRVAEDCGLPVVVSSALDTSVGIRAGLALAGALPQLPYACGLATTGLFAEDVADLAVEDGVMPVRSVAPDPARLLALAAPPERQRWWRERLRRCADLL